MGMMGVLGPLVLVHKRPIIPRAGEEKEFEPSKVIPVAATVCALPALATGGLPDVFTGKEDCKGAPVVSVNNGQVVRIE